MVWLWKIRNLYEKFNCDQLRNEKVLGVENVRTRIPTTRTTFVAIGDPFLGPVVISELAQHCVSDDSLGWWRSRQTLIHHRIKIPKLVVKNYHSWFCLWDESICQISCKSMHWGLLTNACSTFFGKWPRDSIIYVNRNGHAQTTDLNGFHS